MTTAVPDNALWPQEAKLELTGVTQVFNSVSGFSIVLNVEGKPAQSNQANGDPLYMYRMANLPSYGDLTCEAQLSKTDQSLFTWWNQIAAGTLAPKDGTLTLMKGTAPQASFKIVGAVLTSLTISDHGISSPSMATITATFNCLSYERLT